MATASPNAGASLGSLVFASGGLGSFATGDDDSDEDVGAGASLVGGGGIMAGASLSSVAGYNLELQGGDELSHYEAEPSTCRLQRISLVSPANPEGKPWFRCQSHEADHFSSRSFTSFLVLVC